MGIASFTAGSSDLGLSCRRLLQRLRATDMWSSCIASLSCLIRVWATAVAFIRGWRVFAPFPRPYSFFRFQNADRGFADDRDSQGSFHA
jgi:hypothetical protein